MTNLYMMGKMDMVLILMIMDYNERVDGNLFFFGIDTKPFLFFIISSEDESSDISLFFFYLIKEYLINNLIFFYLLILIYIKLHFFLFYKRNDNELR